MYSSTMADTYFVDVQAGTTNNRDGYFNHFTERCRSYNYKHLIYKVKGESNFVAVIRGDVEKIQHLDPSVKISCDPVRSYEGFAQSVLDYPDPPASTWDLAGTGNLYWLNFEANYTGSLDDLLATWKREAQAAMGVRAAGGKIEVFKVVGARRVHSFLRAPSHAVMDDIVWSLPMTKENGANVQIVTKQLVEI